MPYTWSVSGGTLPNGITLTGSSGLLSGTPAATGQFSFTVQITDSSPTPQIATQPFSMTVTASGAPQAPPSITTTSLPSGNQSLAYSSTLGATGGKTPYQWSLFAGTLPTGLTLDSVAGSISGIPTVQGTFNFTVQLTDSSTPAQVATKALQIVIQPPAAPPPSPIQITNLDLNNQLPGGTVGQPYSATMTGTGGSTPYTWLIVSGSLPPGLSMTAGVISGTPTTANTYTFTIQMTDSSSPVQSLNQVTSISIIPAPPLPPPPTPLSIANNLPSATVNVGYSGAITGSGGTPPYNFALSGGTLPVGLALTPGTGVISGTPSTAQTSLFSITLTDAAATSVVGNFSITVDPTPPLPPAPLTILSSSLPNGSVATPYTVNLAATGGVLPYTWSLGSGSLPPGVTLGANGVISGTPTTASTFSFTAVLNDSASPPSIPISQAFTITINPGSAGPPPGVTILTVSLPSGTVNQPYSNVMSAAGGTFPYTWSVTLGTLPTGLTLSAAGIISGTPTSTGTSTVTFQVADSSAPVQTATKQLSLNIVPQGPAGTPLTISPINLSPGNVGTLYSTTIAAVGGTTPYTWSVQSGSLPAGLNLGAQSGIISGTPTTAGQSVFTVQAADNSLPQLTATGQFTITISAATSGKGSLPVSITTTTVPNGTLGTVYSTTIVTSGGTTPLTFGLASGTLPPGLNLGSATGILGGSPTTAGSFNFTAQVVDSASPPTTASQGYSITIVPVPPPPPPPPPAGTPPQFAALFMCQATPAGVGVKTAYNSYPAPGTQPYDGCSAIPSPNDPKPPVYDGTPATVYTDPIFGTKIKRLTLRPGMPAKGYFPMYSTLQPWSANQTWMMALAYQGGALQLFCGKDTGGNECASAGIAQSHYQFIREINDIPYDGFDQAVAMWDNNNDCVFYYTYRYTIRSVNICNNDAVTTIGSFPQMTDSQGNVLDLATNSLIIKPYAYCYTSDDSTKLAARINDGGGAVWAIASFDLTSPNHYFWMHKLSAPGDLVNTNAPHNKQPGGVCMSPDGDYVLVDWNTPSTYTHTGDEQYDAITGAYISRVSPWSSYGFGGAMSHGGSHADQMRLADGSEAVLSSWCVGDVGGSYTYRQFTAYKYDPSSVLGCNPVGSGTAVDQLLASSFFSGQWHVSGRGTIGKTNPNNGWGLASTFNGLAVDMSPQVPMGSEIFATKMDGSNVNFRIAHSQSCRLTQYWAEPHAVPSRDFKHVLFGSNWRNCTTDATQVDLYVIDLQ